MNLEKAKIISVNNFDEDYYSTYIDRESGVFKSYEQVCMMEEPFKKDNSSLEKGIIEVALENKEEIEEKRNTDINHVVWCMISLVVIVLFVMCKLT